MGNYTILTNITDTGPYITKIVLHFPVRLEKGQVGKEHFSIYACCLDPDSGQVASRLNRETGIWEKLRGYPEIVRAYPSDKQGNPQNKSDNIVLELKEEYLNKRIVGDIISSQWLNTEYRITQIKRLSSQMDLCGYVFEKCVEDICPQLAGWREDINTGLEIPLRYGYYTPQEAIKTEKSLPLLIWLHGAGEGGNTTKIAYTGNKVVNLSSLDIQKKLGWAWILVPQSPTVWMDDGIEKIGRSNQSIYSRSLAQLIKGFIQQHQTEIDTNRIFIGGLSNGGFMAIRMMADYPDYFAAGIAVCPPFYQENISAQVLGSLKQIPLWLVHAENDEFVSMKDTSIPLYQQLLANGAKDLHFTIFKEIHDLSGKYKEKDGSPKKYLNHASWIHVYNDDCHTDFDGRKVMVDGQVVTIWEWLGKQNKKNNRA